MGTQDAPEAHTPSLPHTRHLSPLPLTSPIRPFPLPTSLSETKLGTLQMKPFTGRVNVSRKTRSVSSCIIHAQFPDKASQSNKTCAHDWGLRASDSFVEEERGEARGHRPRNSFASAVSASADTSSALSMARARVSTVRSGWSVRPLGARASTLRNPAKM